MYLFWFQVHFAILSRSGPGDDFMTPEFQATLSDNLMTQQAVGIDYFDNIAMRHKETKVYLHSHVDHYPLRYDDGRISSQGQQVTGYPHNDTNNLWQVVPGVALEGLGHPVKHGDTVRFRHLVTDTWLLTHDVASPSMPTNQEFTAVPADEANGARFNDTLFELRIENGKAGQKFTTLASPFKLVHGPTKVALWTHHTVAPLPEWGFKQAEINGNKNLQQTSNVWFVEEVPGLPADSPRLIKEAKQTKRMPFLKKYFELQRAMFFHNNALTSSHPYASFPIQWPFLLRGVSFWTENETRQQIYFLGNPVGWWFASSLLAVFAGILLADQVSVRRGVDTLDQRTRARLYNSTGFFLLLWAAHYAPFFIMGRQLFLHHYLPAHLASALVAGALVEFIFNIEPADVVSNLGEAQQLLQDGRKGKTPTAQQAQQSQSQQQTTVRGGGGTGRPRSGSKPVRERIAGQSLLATWAAAGVIVMGLMWGFWFFAPLTYGRPGLSVEEVNRRKWLNYDLHFAK
ncbi:Dolichyl-phosphate-mannose--protein mannosyltransferase 4 [Teratosphaeriaceae sp. CCFEE 6253]|nr:Dolichyl-phosphate-mannose--protein mannosyltransferase 4 [Teratosphaeriaceae sp. CCFEE 6253]